jgi:hypothetical protein
MADEFNVSIHPPDGGADLYCCRDVEETARHIYRVVQCEDGGDSMEGGAVETGG